MPVVDNEVPQWKKDLIQKRQLWRRSGGWSVPPVNQTTDPTLRPIDFGRSDRSNSNGNRQDDSVETLSRFGSVSELRNYGKDDDVFEPITKARSEENILDVEIDSEVRRSSTSGHHLNSTTGKPVKKPVSAVPKMEEFFRKYRKPSRKTAVERNEVDSPKTTTVNHRRKRSDTIYFLDMNQNELPPPNTVKQTVKTFEEPVKIEKNSPKSDVNVTSDRARDVVKKFEEKIQSGARTAPPKPPRRLGVNPARSSKHVSFNVDVTTITSGDDGATVKNDLKAVAINVNQPLVIKTV